MGTTILEFGNCRLIKYEGKNEIMFCGNCGKQIPDQSAFCPECGTSVRHKESHPVTFENNTEDSGIRKIKCPYCGGHNLQSVSEIVTVTSTTGGGYSGSKGCLGLLLFGPFGLLCGNCGNAQKTEVQNNTKLFWVCGDCGQKFENIDNMQTEIAQKGEQHKVARGCGFCVCHNRSHICALGNVCRHSFWRICDFRHINCCGILFCFFMRDSNSAVDEEKTRI